MEFKRYWRKLCASRRIKQSVPPIIKPWEQIFVDKFLDNLRKSNNQLLYRNKTLCIKNGNTLIHLNNGLITIIEGKNILSKLLEEKTEHYLLKEFNKSYHKKIDLFQLNINREYKSKLT